MRRFGRLPNWVCACVMSSVELLVNMNSRGPSKMFILTGISLKQ